MLDFIWNAFGQTGDIQFYLLYKSFEREYDPVCDEWDKKAQVENTPLC